MAVTIEDLGLTQEELREAVISRLVDQFAVGTGIDEDGDEFVGRSQWYQETNKAIRKAISDKIDAIATEKIIPRVGELIESVCLQETNSWGEKVGKPITFIEYLVDLAEKWVTEKVDFNGNNKAQGGYGWSGSQTRIAYMIHEHLQYSISSAIEQALKNLNSSVAKGLTETVKLQLAEVLGKLKIDVKV